MDLIRAAPPSSWRTPRPRTSGPSRATSCPVRLGRVHRLRRTAPRPRRWRGPDALEVPGTFAERRPQTLFPRTGATWTEAPPR